MEFRLIKKLKDRGRWRIFKLKLIDARLYFVSIFVGLLTGLIAVPYHYLLQFFFNLRHDFFDSHPKWYWYLPLFLLMWGILIFVSWLVKKMPLITGGGIPQTRGVINGRVAYKHPFIEVIAKFVGGILALSTGLSLGREGPSVQIGSYVGCLVSKWGRVLAGERKQLLAAGAGAGLAAAFAAPLASSLLVIESIERFDAPKTAITTLLAGVVAGGVASWLFPINPYFQIDAIVPGMTFWSQVKLFLLLAAVVSVFGKFFSVTTLQVKHIYPAIKHPEYVKMLSALYCLSHLYGRSQSDRRWGTVSVGTGHASRYPYSLDCRYDVVAFCIQYLFFFVRTAGRKFHSYISDRRAFRANSCIDSGSARSDCL